MMPITILRNCNGRLLRLAPQITQRSLASLAASASDGGSYSRSDVWNLLNQRRQELNDTTYSVAFGDDSAFSLSSMIEPSALMQEQLRISENQLRHNSNSNSASMMQAHQEEATTIQKMDNMALPKTLKDVVRQKSRAIVVTEVEKPFRIVDVNHCWEGLCGYSFQEARGKTLGSLLKGPDTNQVAATGLIAHLLQGEEAGAVLTNYTKEGREFQNRIRVGPLYDDENKITHFVGVLEELPRSMTM